MAANNDLISKHFQFFRNADPRIYDRLVALVEARVSEVTVAVTEAPPDQILVAQGRAQEARKWLQLMTEFPPDPPQQGSVIPTPQGP